MHQKRSLTLLKNGHEPGPAVVVAPYLGWSHPLAEVAARHCRAAGHVARVGAVACGACWELAIRDDERFAVECDLPREIVPDPDYVDQVAVRQACRGERVRLTPVERAEAIRRLYAEGLSRGQIASRLFLAFDQVPAAPAAEVTRPTPVRPAPVRPRRMALAVDGAGERLAASRVSATATAAPAGMGGAA
jgi:hypothetical protein